jgi:hypothetical protein
MNFATIDDIRHAGFVGEVIVSALQVSGCREVPDEPGVYLVLRPDARAPDFLHEGTGGRSKGKDPNVKVARLRTKWVEGTVVLNIGKAGGPDIAETLRGRLNKYMRFGQRKNSGTRAEDTSGGYATRAICSCPGRSRGRLPQRRSKRV